MDSRFDAESTDPTPPHPTPKTLGISAPWPRLIVIDCGNTLLISNSQPWYNCAVCMPYVTINEVDYIHYFCTVLPCVFLFPLHSFSRV